MKFKIERLEQKNQPSIGTGTAIAIAIAGGLAGLGTGALVNS